MFPVRKRLLVVQMHAATAMVGLAEK
jgi:hypothetical protein